MGNQRSNVLQRFFGVHEGLINTNVQKTLRELSIKIFQEHSHLMFSEHFFVLAGITHGQYVQQLPSLFSPKLLMLSPGHKCPYGLIQTIFPEIARNLDSDVHLFAVIYHGHRVFKGVSRQQNATT